MRRTVIIHRLTFKLAFLTSVGFIHGQKSSISFTVSMDQPASHTFHVTMTCAGFKDDSLDLKMPVWTPGYYQRLDFANNVWNFQAYNTSKKTFGWRKTSSNAWRIKNSASLILEYDVKTSRPFVATPYLDEERGYVLPAGVFFFTDGNISHRGKNISISLGKKIERSFRITRKHDVANLQKAILESWLGQ